MILTVIIRSLDTMQIKNLVTYMTEGGALLVLDTSLMALRLNVVVECFRALAPNFANFRVAVTFGDTCFRHITLFDSVSNVKPYLRRNFCKTRFGSRRVFEFLFRPKIFQALIALNFSKVEISSSVGSSIVIIGFMRFRNHTSVEVESLFTNGFPNKQKYKIGRRPNRLPKLLPKKVLLLYVLCPVSAPVLKLCQ